LREQVLRSKIKALRRQKSGVSMINPRDETLRRRGEGERPDPESIAMREDAGTSVP
jgi:hypothetical protein